jgi:hypothetical protein
MGKILFWIAVAFVVLLVLRLVNFAAAKARKAAKGPQEPPKAIPPAEPTVRCVQCGTFVPKSEALPAPTGYRCADPACPRRG